MPNYIHDFGADLKCKFCGVDKKQTLLEVTPCLPLVSSGKTIKAKLVRNYTGETLKPGKIMTTEPKDPEYIYVGGRTFWDWLAEIEWPKLKINLLVGLHIVWGLVAVGLLFFAYWFNHHGTEWAREPITILTIIVGFAWILSCIGLLIAWADAP